jgi:hypothetical protein
MEPDPGSLQAHEPSKESIPIPLSPLSGASSVFSLEQELPGIELSLGGSNLSTYPSMDRAKRLQADIGLMCIGGHNLVDRANSKPD